MPRRTLESRAQETQNAIAELNIVWSQIKGLEHDPMYPTPFTYSELWERTFCLAHIIKRNARYFHA